MIFIRSAGFVKLRKHIFYGHFSKWFLAEGRFPTASGFWEVQKPNGINKTIVSNHVFVNNHGFFAKNHQKTAKNLQKPIKTNTLQLFWSSINPIWGISRAPFGNQKPPYCPPAFGGLPREETSSVAKKAINYW